VAVIAIAVGGRAVTSRRTGAVGAASVPPDAPVAAVAIAIGVDPQPLAFRPLDDAPFARVPLVNRFTIDDPGPPGPARRTSARAAGRRLGAFLDYRADPYER
jgi:hypothetical protein